MRGFIFRRRRIASHILSLWCKVFQRLQVWRSLHAWLDFADAQNRLNIVSQSSCLFQSRSVSPVCTIHMQSALKDVIWYLYYVLCRNVEIGNMCSVSSTKLHSFTLKFLHENEGEVSAFYNETGLLPSRLKTPGKGLYVLLFELTIPFMCKHYRHCVCVLHFRGDCHGSEWGRNERPSAFASSKKFIWI